MVLDPLVRHLEKKEIRSIPNTIHKYKFQMDEESQHKKWHIQELKKKKHKWIPLQSELEENFLSLNKEMIIFTI